MSDTAPEQSDHEHDWRLAEDGYSRVWRGVTVDDDGTIRPADGGEFTDDGDGQLYLECDCGAAQEVPDDKVRWV